MDDDAFLQLTCEIAIACSIRMYYVYSPSIGFRCTGFIMCRPPLLLFTLFSPQHDTHLPFTSNKIIFDFIFVLTTTILIIIVTIIEVIPPPSDSSVTTFLFLPKGRGDRVLLRETYGPFRSMRVR